MAHNRRAQHHITPQPVVSGFMFVASHETIDECLRRNLFGLPHSMFSRMDSITDSSLIFLHAKDSKEIHGIYRPDGRPAMNIEPTAYKPLTFPAQLRIGRTSLDTRVPTSALPWPVRFGPLTEDQVEDLQKAFLAAAPTSPPYKPKPTGAAGTRAPRPAVSEPASSEHASRPAGGSASGPASASPGVPTAKSGKTAKGLQASAPSAAAAPALEATAEETARRLMIARLEQALERLKGEPRVVPPLAPPGVRSPASAAAASAAWLARFAALDDELAGAIMERDFFKAAVVQQHVEDLKLEQEACVIVAQTDLSSPDAVRANVAAAVRSNKMFAAAVVEARAPKRAPVAMPALASVEAASLAEAEIAALLSSIGVADTYTEALVQGGILSASDLANVSDKTLETLGFKKGTRIKIAKWQTTVGGGGAEGEPAAPLASDLLPSPAAAASPPAPPQRPLAPISPPGLAAPVPTPAGPPAPPAFAPLMPSPPPLHGEDTARLAELVCGELMMPQHCLDSLLETGIETPAALLAQTPESLSATGLKKGPRLKLLTYISENRR